MTNDYERVNFWTIEFPEKKTETKQINEVPQEETTSQLTDKSLQDETVKSA